MRIVRLNKLLVIGSLVLVAACGSSTKSSTSGAPTSTTSGSTGAQGDFKADPNKTYTATITTNMGTIVLALDSKHAPIAAGRFIELARAKFYDGLTFHRASKNFVIQGGDPKGDGTGGSGRPPVIGEVPTDNYPIGSLAAAKSGLDAPGTFDCQFFIVTGDGGMQLDNVYARFGMVTKGQDVAKAIENLAPATGDGPPTKKVTIKSITIAES